MNQTPAPPSGPQPASPDPHQHGPGASVAAGGASSAGSAGPLAGSQTPDALDRFFGWLRSLGLSRRVTDKWFGGVASGVADRLRVDPVVIRAGLVLATLLFGFGIGLYLVAWSLLPDRKGRIAAERGIRHGDGGSIFLLIVTVVALSSGLPWWFDGNVGWGVPWGLLIVGGIVWWAVAHHRAKQTPEQRAEWSRRASAWGEDVGTRVGAWGDDVGQRVTAWGERVGGSGDDAARRDAPGTPMDTPRMAAVPSAPAGTALAGPAVPAAAPAEPVQPNLRRRSGGFMLALLTLGVALVTFGATYWLGTALDWTGHIAIAWYTTLGVLGLLVLGLGVAGWRTGFAGFAALTLAAGAALSLVVPDGRAFNGRLGDVTWAPTTVTGETAYEHAAGEVELDLTGLPPDGLTAAPLRASLGLGELTVRVPSDLTVEVHAQVGFGAVELPDGQSAEADRRGPGIDTTTLIGTGPPEVELDASVGFGQLTIIKE